MNDTSNRTRRLAATVAAALMGAALILATAAADTAACGICGKNLIKNPGADAGLGVMLPMRSAQFPAAECLRPVRRGLLQVPERLVLGELQGPEGPGQELLLRRPRAAAATVAASIG